MLYLLYLFISCQMILILSNGIQFLHDIYYLLCCSSQTTFNHQFLVTHAWKNANVDDTSCVITWGPFY